MIEDDAAVILEKYGLYIMFSIPGDALMTRTLDEIVSHRKDPNLHKLLRFVIANIATGGYAVPPHEKGLLNLGNHEPFELPRVGQGKFKIRFSGYNPRKPFTLEVTDELEIALKLARPRYVYPVRVKVYNSGIPKSINSHLFRF